MEDKINALNQLIDILVEIAGDKDNKEEKELDILTEKGEEYQKDKEIWKDISGYEGLYQVSNYGRVMSYMKEYRKKESYKEKQREYIKEHREKINEQARKNYWRRKYGEDRVQTAFAGTD